MTLLYSIVYVYHIFLIYLSVVGHLRCLYSLDTASNAVLSNRSAYIPSNCFYIHSPGNHLGVKLLDHKVDSFLIFCEMFQFSIGAGPAYIPTNSIWGFLFLHIFVSGLFNIGHSQRYEVVALCRFDLCFPSKCRWAFFHVPMATSVSFCGELSLLCGFLCGELALLCGFFFLGGGWVSEAWFFLGLFVWFLCKFCLHPFWDVWCYRYFLPFVTVSFHLMVIYLFLLLRSFSLLGNNASSVCIYKGTEKLIPP